MQPHVATSVRIRWLAGLSLVLLCAFSSGDDADRLVAEIAAQREGLRAVLTTLDAQEPVFSRVPLSEPRLLGPEERELARSLWAAFADLLLALEQSEERAHEERVSPSRRERLAIRRAAFLARYRFAMDFIERVDRDPGLGILFDEAQPSLGLPERSYARLKFHYLNVSRATEFAAFEVVHRAGGKPTPEPLAEGAREDAERILEMGRGAGPRMTASNGAKVLRDAAHSAWLPAQERVARWAGDLRVRRIGQALITEAQIRQLRPQLEPGDLLLQRREWYLTNAGIPGFWTHAALYVGDREERESFFDDPEVRRWTGSVGQPSFEALLRARHPEAWKESQQAEDGHPPRVLEAVAEGVTFTSLEHSAHADSIAVLRPRLSKRERAKALLRAFGYAGRPYDYDFDFATDAALVCSELVYKVYQPGTGTRGLELPLSSVAGRLMLTPNEIARRYGSPREGGEPQLDFVLMLDGSERADVAHPVSEEVFATSWSRPKWHILTAEGPSPASR
jgi:hypothetical protein